MYEGIDTVVLYDELAYRDVLPVAWRASSTAPTGELQQSMNASNLRILQVCVALSEQGQREKTDDGSVIAADIQRLEMKINLILELVGRIAAADVPRPTATRVQFNARGAIWKNAGVTGKPGDEGSVEIHLREYIAEPLRLAGRITAESGGQTKVKFHALGEGVADCIEKLAFRQHRRQVADQRQPRDFDPTRTGRLKLK